MAKMRTPDDKLMDIKSNEIIEGGNGSKVDPGVKLGPLTMQQIGEVPNEVTMRKPEAYYSGTARKK